MQYLLTTLPHAKIQRGPFQNTLLDGLMPVFIYINFIYNLAACLVTALQCVRIVGRTHRQSLDC